MDNPTESKSPPAKRVKLDPRKASVQGRLARCRDWVDDQDRLAHNLEQQDKRDDNHSATSDDDESQPVRDEYDELSYIKLQRRMRKKNIADLVIPVSCEWKSCKFSTENYPQFRLHVRRHIPDVKIHSYKGGENLYECLWNMCGFETKNDREIKRHINFHSYHTRIKAVGIDVRDRFCLRRCTRDPSQRNQVPELLTDHICMWTGCTLSFTSIQDFIDHVQCHILGADQGPDSKLICGWLGCPYRFATINRMKMHSRKHTGERVVGCSECGGTFATNAVYEDHCLRQTATVAKFKCETCGKFFSSERLLRSHARRHINSHKCTYCDMTFSSPSALITHIRYCHLNYRPFQCRYCDYTAVSKADIDSHIERHENVKHMKKIKTEIRTYACQCCEEFFSKGNHLTKHLVRVHGYCQSTGFPRFRYKKSEDGFYRLIPVRYESLEVSNQINASQNEENTLELSVKNEYDNEDQEFKLIQCVAGDSERPASFVLLPTNVDDKTSRETVLSIQEYANKCVNNANNIKPVVKKNVKQIRAKKTSKKRPKKRMKKKAGKGKKGNVSNSSSLVKSNSPKVIQKESKSIQISIADLDEDGNVIKSQVMESQEIILGL